MLTKQLRDIIELDNFVAGLYKDDENLRNSKFGYSYTKFYKKYYEPVLKKIKEELEDLQIEYALEDEKTKAVIRDENSPRGFAYSKEGLASLIKKEREVMTSFEIREIEIEEQDMSIIIKIEELINQKYK